MKPIGLLLALSLVASGDPAEDGARHFREGRFAEALADFASAEKAAGEAATPVLLHNLALAALRAGDPALAEAAAEKMAARGGPAFAPLREFVRGNAAFARAERAALLASQPEAEPFAFDAATALAETARAAWQRAALSRDDRLDWPEARRNAERALLAIAEFEKLKKEAEAKRRKKEKEPPPPPPEPEKPPEAEPEPEEAEVAPALDLLSEADVKRLIERLNAKEREKMALRRAERRARAGGTERDW